MPINFQAKRKPKILENPYNLSMLASSALTMNEVLSAYWLIFYWIRHRVAEMPLIKLVLTVLSTRAFNASLTT